MSEHDEIQRALRRSVDEAERAGSLAYEAGYWFLATQIGRAADGMDRVACDVGRLNELRREARVETAQHIGGEP